MPFFHKILDQNTGEVPMVSIRPDWREADLKSRSADFVRRMASAHCFCFENVPIENDETDASSLLPGPTSEEIGMFADFLIPTPFETCWFEIENPIRGHEYRETYCYLLKDTAEGVIIEPVRVVSQAASNDMPRQYAVFHGISMTIQKLRRADGKLQMMIPDFHIKERNPDALYTQEQLISECRLVVYLLVMLCSRSTQMDTVIAPAKLNKARAKRGKPPIPEYAVVSIIPRDVAQRMRKDGDVSGTDLRASPRLHWRRSHTRTLADGKVVPVIRALVGYKTHNGEDIVPRHYRVEADDRN